MQDLACQIYSVIILTQWTQSAPNPLDKLNINLFIDDGKGQSHDYHHAYLPSHGNGAYLPHHDYEAYPPPYGNGLYQSSYNYEPYVPIQFEDTISGNTPQPTSLPTPSPSSSPLPTPLPQPSENGTQSEGNVTQSQVNGTHNKVNVTKEIPGQTNGIQNCECGKVNQIPDPKYNPNLNYTGCSDIHELHVLTSTESSGGAHAIPNQYPFMADLKLRWRLNITTAKSRTCGGTLISNRHILTASHCIPPHAIYNKSYILLGGHRRKREEEFVKYFIKDSKFPPGISCRIKKYETKCDHDIAIIVLNTSVKFTKNIAPICLPQPNEIIDHKFKAIAIGWGDICNEEPATRSDKLKHVQIKLSDINDLNRPVLLYNFNNKQNFLISLEPTQEGRRQNPGVWDSGGPLIQLIKVTDPLHYKLIGAISTGVRKMDNGTIILSYGLYAAIKPFLRWIKQTVASEPGSYICKARI